jgi:hypothetical protein
VGVKKRRSSFIHPKGSKRNVGYQIDQLIKKIKGSYQKSIRFFFFFFYCNNKIEIEWINFLKKLKDFFFWNNNFFKNK